MTELSRFAEMTWPEVEELSRQGFVAILPVGSTEAHGPHLPLCTDVLIADGMASRAVDLLAKKGLRAVVLPPVTYTVTDCAAEFPGTVTTSAESLRVLLRDLGASLATQGARCLVLANGHLEPDHRQVLKQATDGSAKRNLPVVFPDYVRRRFASRLGEEFLSGACHAGEYETSMVLAVRPDLVREELRAALPENPISLGQALSEGKNTFLAAGGPQAYFGAPAQASAEAGERYLQELATILVEEVDAAIG